MKQVNCIESGDLCEREHIDFYPNILLYAPAVDKDGKKTGKLKTLIHFQEISIEMLRISSNIYEKPRPNSIQVQLIYPVLHSC